MRKSGGRYRFPTEYFNISAKMTVH